jgi:cell filamentation protein
VPAGGSRSATAPRRGTPFREGNGRAQRAFFAQLARSTGFTLAWQHLHAARNVEASAAIMRGDPEPMRKMLDALLRDGT